MKIPFLRLPCAVAVIVFAAVTKSVFSWDLVISPADSVIESSIQTPLVLICQALGLKDNDDPRLLWKDNSDAPITATTGSVYVEKPANNTHKSILHITSMRKTLTGQYTCTGTVYGQTKTARRQLSIKSFPQILQSSPKHVNATTGLTIALSCQVLNQGSNEVKWIFETHNQVLSSNNKILIQSASKQYSIVRPMGNLLGTAYNLQIESISQKEAGVYRCEMGKQKQITTVTVIDAEEVKKPALIPSADFTDCCKEKGVSANCQPVCNPRSLDLSKFDMANCALDVKNLLACGADKRNHLPCCRERYVPEVCLDLCLQGPDFSIGFQHLSCLNYSMPILQCYEEGQFLLPSPPTKVSASDEGSGSIFINWMAPAENSNSVTGYKVFFRSKGSAAYHSTSALPVNSRLYKLSSMDPGVYEAYVIALSAHGASMPSYIVEIRTGDGTDPDQPPKSANETLSGCCKRRGVSDACQKLLCEGSPSGMDQRKLLVCSSDIKNVLTCVAGERNHTSCCERRGIKPECVSMCWGQPPKETSSLVSCFLSQMLPITSCFQEGVGVLPSAPKNVVVTSVTDVSAKVSWQPGTSATSYIIIYKEHNSEKAENKVIVNSQRLSYTLLSLKPQHMYQVSVVAYNDRGSSIPSPHIIFLTHSSAVTETPTTAPQTPYNVSACCLNSGVKPQCMGICTYNLEELYNVTQQMYLDCEMDLVKILRCGHDNRDHIPCCKRSGMSDLCLPLCQMSANFTFSNDHLMCISYTPDMVNCMQEGIATKPSSPINVRVSHVTTNNIELMWQPPLKQPKGVDYYLVEYMKDVSQGSPIQVKQEKVNGTRYILQNLAADTMYRMRVTALNSYGSSLPSVILYQRTLSKMPSPTVPPTQNHPANISECCKQKAVSGTCQPLCERSVGWSYSLLTCFADFRKLLSCAADGADHSKCCERHYVSSLCMPICAGDVSKLPNECLFHAPSILTCFYEGRGKLPSPPTYFQMEQVHIRYAIFSWKAPSRNAAGVNYTIHVMDVGNKSTVKEETVGTLRYNVTGLKPDTLYRVYVIAANGDGLSLPSSVISFYTKKEYAPVINIVQKPLRPGGIHEIGDHIILTCQADGSPPPQVWWKFKTQIFRVNTLPLDHIKVADHGGLYTCVADNGIRGQVSKSIYIKIRSKLIAVAVHSEVKQRVNVGLQSVLNCYFWGYPDQVKWYFNGSTEVPPPGKASVYKSSVIEVHGGEITQASLIIQLVRSHHLGVYKCVGTNSKGSKSAIISLQNADSESELQPFPKQHNVTACCIRNGVHPVCQNLCHFGITLSSLQALHPKNVTLCEAEVPKMLQCAANGRDNSKCCRQRKVALMCESFCLGRMDPSMSLSDKLQCLVHLDDIVNCLEQGNVMIPGPPRSLTAGIVQGNIRVTWQPPATNFDAVKAYKVVFNKTHMLPGYEENSTSFSFQTELTSAIITDLSANTKYEIYVVAFNNLGNSHPSVTKTVKTSEFIPSAPYDVRLSLVNGIHIEVKWKEPHSNAGPVTVFHVYYKDVSYRGGHSRTDVVGSYDTILTGLKANTKYEIFVTANNTEHESEPSQKVYITTTSEISVLPPPSPRRGRGNMSVTIGVSLFFVLLVICLVVAAGVIYYMRVKRKSLRFKESVSFENPGYVRSLDANESVQITGLPDEPMNPDQSRRTTNGHGPTRNGKHNMYGVSSDTHSDNSFTELSPPLTGHSSDQECATLDISQMETLEGVQLPYDSSLSKI